MSRQRLEQQLALNGGMRAVTRIEGKGKPKIGVDEFLAVAERFGFSPPALAKIRAAAEADGLGDGPFLANYYSDLKETSVQAYERTARTLFKAKYAVATSSGTGALHAAFVAAGVGPGTEVICPAIGFFATSAAVVHAKGIPVFCDVDDTLMLDPRKIEALITPRTVALAPTHFMGGVCDMPAIMKIARRHRLKVVEDCAQSCGGSVNGRLVGTFGDLGCFSISAYKIVGGGEGGLLLTNDKRLWERANQLAECGGLWRPVRFAAPRYPGELFCGTNYRLSELEAAVDVVQLRKMPATVKRFNQVKLRILRDLKTFREIVPQRLIDPAGEVGYSLRFYPATLALSSKIAEALRAENIPASARGAGADPDWHVSRYMFPVTLKTSSTPDGCPFTCPHYLQRGGRIEYHDDDCPVAADLFDRNVSIRLSQWYNARDCRNIARGINKVLASYCTPDPDGAPWLSRAD
jgi:8-amino-3,8-dideoxy-alpha-D-manno-octulosonate transaminase